MITIFMVQNITISLMNISLHGINKDEKSTIERKLLEIMLN